MRFGPGIRPSRTSSSNLLADMPRYIAASSRDNPRRGIGRTAARPVDRFVGVGRFKSFGLSSARSDLVFALGDKLRIFIAGLLFARNAFTSIQFGAAQAGKAVCTSQVTACRPGQVRRELRLRGIYTARVNWFSRTSIFTGVNVGGRRRRLAAARHVALLRSLFRLGRK